MDMDWTPILQSCHALWRGDITLPEFAIVWMLCVGVHLSILRWWGTDLPALFTRLATRLSGVRSVLGVTQAAYAAIVTHKAWDRHAWLVWLNTHYRENSEGRTLLAHMLSCTQCLSFHVGYLVAITAWGLSLTTSTPLGLVHCVVLTFAMPGLSLTLLSGAAPRPATQTRTTT